MSAQLEEERKQYEEQLEIVNASLKDDPSNAELLALKDELDQMISLIEDSLAELKPKAKPVPAPAPSKPAAPAPQPEKWSRENHPAFKKAAAPPPPPSSAPAEDEAPAVYQVNDTVMAKWLSGDKGFYAARITSVTGSSTNPIYTVKFKSYGGSVETLRAKDVRPAGGGAGGAAQKRKAEADAPAPPSSTTAAAGGGGGSNGVVTTAPAKLNPLAQKAADGEGDAGGGEKPAKKFKKIKANKELEAGKSKWQEFNAKGKFGKTAKKDSMFRTPEGVHGRVGFTGSGQAMRKDAARSRHIYQPNEDLD